MASYWKKGNMNNQKLPDLMLKWLNLINYEKRWSQSVKNTLINCGIPTRDNDVNYVNDNEFNKYIKRYCEDLANQSWQTMTRATPMCECYSIYKQKAELEMNIRKMNFKERIGLTHFRCAPVTSQTVKDKIQGNKSNTCPFCQEKCRADEYHLLLVCKCFQTDRERLPPQYFCNYPNLIKLDQLMNTVKIDNLNNLSVLCRIICNASASITGDNPIYISL